MYKLRHIQSQISFHYYSIHEKQNKNEQDNQWKLTSIRLRSACISLDKLLYEPELDNGLVVTIDG